MEREEKLILGIRLLAPKLKMCESNVCRNILGYNGIYLKQLENGKSVGRKKYNEFKEKFLQHGIDLDNLPDQPQEA